MRFAFASLLFAGALAAAPVPKDLKKPDDAALIVGTWTPTDGNTVRFQFAADGTMKTLYPNGSGPVEWTWSVTDAKAIPKRMLLRRVDAPISGYECAYEMAGDTLKIGFFGGGQPAPEKLVPGKDISLYQLTREKPAK